MVHEYTLSDLEEKYELELERVIKEIRKNKPKKVLLQFPDGLKPYATEIAGYLEEKLKAQKTEFRIWLRSCFGACDIPINQTDCDLIVQFGHAEWK